MYDRRWTLHVNLRRAVEAASRREPEARTEALLALETQLTDADLSAFPNRPPFGRIGERRIRDGDRTRAPRATSRRR
jgi:hypothetical protein